MEDNFGFEEEKENFEIFVKWARVNHQREDLYDAFVVQFSRQYRMDLFKNMIDFFDNAEMVSDKVLYYWKHFIIHLLQKSKYQSQLGKLVYNPIKMTTNLRLIKGKYMFHCYIDGEELCYFKENDWDWFVS